MALLTRLQARTLIQQLVDDTGATLWSAPNLDILTEGAIDELWGELLDKFEWVRSTEAATLTPTAPGYVTLSTAFTRFYRLQMVARDNQAFWPANQKDVLVINGVQIVAPDHTYVVYGDQLHLFPYSLNQISVRYNSRPTAYTALANDSALVDWPDGYHMAYIYDAASKAMEKGDRENSERFGKRAEQSMFRLKSFLRKQQVGPIMPWFHQDAIEWGGQ